METLSNKSKICSEISAGIAVIARDSNGQFLTGDSNLIRASSPRAAEAFAVRLAANLVVENHWPHVIIESDNKSLVNSLQKELANCWDSAAIERDTRELLQNFRVEFSFCPRDANSCADFIAKFVMSTKCKFNWQRAFPSQLVSLLDIDVKNNSVE